MNGPILLFGYECVVVVGRTVAISDVFAQASMSHLGETSRNRLRWRALVWARYYLAQARRARLSDDAWELEARCYSCNPGEEPQLWERGGLAQGRGGLAQARRDCLSENSRVLQGSLLTVSP